MSEEVQILITSGVGIRGTIYVPGDIVSVTLGEAIAIKAIGRATDVPDPVLGPGEEDLGPGKYRPAKGKKPPVLDTDGQ